MTTVEVVFAFGVWNYSAAAASIAAGRLTTLPGLMKKDLPDATASW